MKIAALLLSLLFFQPVANSLDITCVGCGMTGSGVGDSGASFTAGFGNIDGSFTETCTVNTLLTIGGMNGFFQGCTIAESGCGGQNCTMTYSVHVQVMQKANMPGGGLGCTSVLFDVVEPVIPTGSQPIADKQDAADYVNKPAYEWGTPRKLPLGNGAKTEGRFGGPCGLGGSKGLSLAGDTSALSSIFTLIPGADETMAASVSCASCLVAGGSISPGSEQ